MPVSLSGEIAVALVRLRVTGGSGYRGISNPEGSTLAMNRCTITGNAGGITNSGTATLRYCTISGNTARYGGGIEVGQAGSLALHGCVVEGNRSPDGEGGGIYSWGTLIVDEATVIAANTAQEYAGIFGAGQLMLDGAMVEENTSDRTAGGVYCANGATCTIRNSTFKANSHYGLQNAGTLTASDCRMIGNGDAGFANLGGPALVTDFEILDNASGVYCDDASDLVITDSEISGNRGPGIRIGGSFSGERLAIRDNAGVGLVNGGNLVTLRSCTMSGNWVAGNYLGGGVVNSQTGTLRLIGCTVSGNSSGGGAGLFNGYGSTLELENSVVLGNTALTGTGGGIENFGTLTITGGEVSGNLSWWHGGGISSSGSLTVTGGVIRGNESGTSTNNGAGQGGGVYNGENGSVDLTDALITGNKTSMAGGGVANHYRGIVTFRGTSKVVNNTPDNCTGTFTCPG